MVPTPISNAASSRSHGHMPMSSSVLCMTFLLVFSTSSMPILGRTSDSPPRHSWSWHSEESSGATINDAQRRADRRPNSERDKKELRSVACRVAS